MSSETRPVPADLLIHSAVIWSAGRVLPQTAVAIAGGRILELGDESLRQRVLAAREVDARGGLLTPSFVDVHVHAALGGIEMSRCDLTGAESAEEVFETVADYAGRHPGAAWILGGGWRMPFFPGGTPLKEDLDRIVPDRPAFLINSDHHGAWANSLALELAGITADTPDPSDGRIERDARGNPSGTLHEGAAELLSPVLPETGAEEARAGLLTAQRRLLGFGITGWQEAILGEYAGYPDLTPIYRELVDRGELRARATGALWVSRDFDGMGIPEFVRGLVARRDRYARDGLRLDTAKIMVDGVPENETAALTEPYLDPTAGACACQKGAGPKGTGLAYFSREQLLELVPLLNKAGLDAHFHAIGDRAVRYALDAVEAVPAAVRAARRNHIAHIQVVDPVDLPRFGELGVTANAQPLWACLDEQMLDLTLPLLGETRAGWQYPFRSLLRSGATLAFGSDWPVSTPDPWQGVHVAVTRQEPGGTGLDPLLPDEALTLDDALTAYTFESHRLIGLPGGSIEPGAVADLALADRDPFAGPAAELHLTRNRLTVLGGDVVHGA
ncbi:amidohydrolase [Leucobacter weissii]|uniref:Amidohydrolase n=1 Tax=Leucobacter weissii TaxID=1983706 RepID=A0A939MLB4_9MICO|nr:amidohydrolase [Leucobacter weissii]MBO1903078.1 amidohydrolase [Leucobacter weissii]